MPGIRNVISTLDQSGEEVMGPDILLWHYPDNNIMNGSLLTVESNHFCVLKSRGAILNVYETGQYTVQTPDRPLFGSMQQAFYGGQSPWQYEAMYVNRAKLVLKTSGVALSREMAEMVYSVDYYIHVETREHAVQLVQHMPYRGHVLNIQEVNAYAGPVIEQAVNQLVQVTPLEAVNERIHDLSQLVHQHLQEFLAISSNVDYSAQLTKKGEHMVFVNPAYEAKSGTWKFCYRCGKEAVNGARKFAQDWLKSLK